MRDYRRRKIKTKAKTTIKKKSKPAPALQELSAHQIIRYRDAEPYFGYRHAQLEALIKAGKIPKPIRLSEGGKASGWTGKMILDHHKEPLKQLPAKNQTPEEA